jgi:hypothetical protein
MDHWSHRQLGGFSMLPHLTSKAQLMALTQYDRIMVYLFREITRNYSQESMPSTILFDLGDVRLAMERAVTDGVLKKPIKNVADIKYTYDARRELPTELTQAGPLTWLAMSKGKYQFRKTRRKNLIDLPLEEMLPPKLEIVLDQTPASISPLLGEDEQAAFTRVRNAGLINSMLGFLAWHIQGHHRTTVNYGQIEIDEVHAGIGPENELTVIPISGKGGVDKLSWSQALNLNTYGAEKFRRHHVKVKSVGLWRDPKNDIWIIEFSPELDIDKIEIVKARRFQIKSN